MKVSINQDKCDRSPACMVRRFCPKGAVKQEKGSFLKGGKVTVDEALCAGCTICMRYCPHHAVEVMA